MITGGIIAALPPFPWRDVLSGVFGLGASILNPTASLADIRRSEASIKLELKQNFLEISTEMKEVTFQLTKIESKVTEVLKIVRDGQYLNGLEKISAAFEMFLDGQGNLEKMFQTFSSKLLISR